MVPKALAQGADWVARSVPLSPPVSVCPQQCLRHVKRLDPSDGSFQFLLPSLNLPKYPPDFLMQGSKWPLPLGEAQLKEAAQPPEVGMGLHEVPSGM